MNRTDPQSSETPTLDKERHDGLDADLAAAAQLRAIEQLRGGLEHELRSPLNAIVLNLELLREMIRSGGSDNAVPQLERIEIISTALKRLQRGLDEVLNQVEEADPTVATFDLNDVVDEVQRLVGPEMRQRGLRLVVATVPEPLRVRGRAERQRQALLQMLINAVEASAPDQDVRLTSFRDDGSCGVEIEDSGTGIAPESQEKIFDRHFSTRDGQAGIGLYVAKNLIEADGGSVGLARTGGEGEGTLFRLRYPEVSD